jgi:hypothetical protein
MKRVLGIALWAACVLALAPGAALADVSDADRATARALAEEGRVALSRADYRTAEDRFTRADALIHAPTLLLGLARAQTGLGKLVEANESYRRIVREGVRPGSPAVFNKAVDDAAREADVVAARLAWVTIAVSPSASAAVALDGAAIPQAAIGAKRPVNPGTHRIRAMAPGHQARDETFSVGEAERKDLTLVLVPVPGAGASFAPSPVASSGLPGSVDPHGGAGEERDLTKPAVGGGPVDVDADVSSRGSANRVAAGVAFVVGAGGLVTGAITGGLAMRKHAALERACPDGACGPEKQEDIDDFRRLSTASTIGFIVGGAGAATGVVLLLTAPSGGQRASSSSVSAYVGLGTFGMKGHF